ncbi:class B sortase [Slackia heliotrinireducens]|uniref:class B sortase n=1 Tax=Slackia heliotrinireducens TaxID=84110 RepID=UPI00331622EC
MRHAAEQTTEKRLSPALIAVIVVLVLALAGAVGGIAYLAKAGEQTAELEQRAEQTEIPETPEVPDSTVEDTPDETLIIDNPVDFDALREEAPNTMGWLYVPNTNINQAVMQHPEDNSFYLTHNEVGEAFDPGAAFIELYNSPEFTDSVTVVYGHNWEPAEQQFYTLHRFQEDEFFDDNELFYIYAPGHIYTYKIVSAFTTDNSHILATYDFANPDQFASFEDWIAAPESIDVHTREVEMDENSRIVVLSTCNTGAIEQYSRYLVCGVMIDDTSTK